MVVSGFNNARIYHIVKMKITLLDCYVSRFNHKPSFFYISVIFDSLSLSLQFSSFLSLDLAVVERP